MNRATTWAGVSLIALWATGAQAQGNTPVPQTSDGATQRREYRDAQGRPVSPELQRRIGEAMRAGPPPPSGGTTPANGDLVVTGASPRGSVIGTVPPERSFDTLDVRAFGATDISELLDVVGPQLRSNRGRGGDGPVTLLNGRRVSNFAEIARIPAEAIERMDVFPEELALRYGYRADQKVVNIVTFPRFRSLVAQTNALVPTEGGTATGGASVDQLVLNGNTRLGLGATYMRTSALTEAERDLLQPGGDAQLARQRTLLPRQQRLALNGVIAMPLTDEIGAAFNGQFEASDLAALLGQGSGGPIARDTTTRRGRIGTVLDGQAGRWLWSLTGGYEQAATTVLTDRADANARRDRARSTHELAEADLIASGPLFALPAGPVTASIGGGFATRAFRGTALLDGATQATRLARDRGAARAVVDLPITRGGGGIGALSVYANAEIALLSDAGTLRTLGSGVVWSPVAAVGFVASVTQEEGAPTVEQIGAPMIVTPAARTYDFANAVSVDVPRIFGGNPALVADDRRVLRAGLTLQPIPRTDLTVSLDYVDTRIDDPIFAFPILTPALEAAFPDRFRRAPGGELAAIDARPLNFARSTLRQVRTGISFTRPLGDAAAGLPPGSSAQTRVFASAAEAEAWVRRRTPNAAVLFATAEPGSAAARRGETLRSRFYLNLFHNWTLTDALTLVQGGPSLDRLDGFATDLRGGRRRHEIQLQVGAFKRGIGGRIGANWQSATRIAGSGGTGDLAFDDFGTVDLTMFVDPAERLGGTKAPDWVKQTRVTLGIVNLFNARPSVRDAAGRTPSAFQPAFLDPLGRSVSLTLRKRF